jgi:hypothetical protein
VGLAVVAFALADYVLLCLVAAFEKNLPQKKWTQRRHVQAVRGLAVFSSTGLCILCCFSCACITGVVACEEVCDRSSSADVYVRPRKAQTCVHRKHSLRCAQTCVVVCSGPLEGGSHSLTNRVPPCFAACSADGSRICCTALMDSDVSTPKGAM